MAKTPKSSLSTSRQSLEFLGESEQDALKAAAAMAADIMDADLRGEPFQLTRFVRKLPGSCPCRPTNAPTP